MSLFRNTAATLTFAGEPIMQTGDLLPSDDDIFSIDLQFTTQTVDLLDAATPALGNFGNTKEGKTFTVIRHYATPEEAMTAGQQLADFAAAHPLGTLTYTCGAYTRTWSAGLTAFRANTSVPGQGVRVTYAWEFQLTPATGEQGNV